MLGMPSCLVCYFTFPFAFTARLSLSFHIEPANSLQNRVTQSSYVAMTLIFFELSFLESPLS